MTEPSFYLTDVSAIERQELQPAQWVSFLWCVFQKVYRFSCLTLVQPLCGCIPYVYFTKHKQATPKNLPAMRARVCMKFTIFGTNWEMPNLYNVDTNVKWTLCSVPLASLLGSLSQIPCFQVSHIQMSPLQVRGGQQCSPYSSVFHQSLDLTSKEHLCLV